MRLKIYNSRNRLRWQADVESIEEAQEFFTEKSKPSDYGYLYIESSMREECLRPRYKHTTERIIRSESGRILSRKEVGQMNLQN